MLDWKNLKNFDELLLEAEKDIIGKIEKNFDRKKLCPHLKKEGESYYFCNLNLAENDIKDKKPLPGNIIYQRHVKLSSLQAFCIKDYKKCLYLKNTK